VSLKEKREGICSGWGLATVNMTWNNGAMACHSSWELERAGGDGISPPSLAGLAQHAEVAQRRELQSDRQHALGRDEFGPEMANAFETP
jgi:hypothetical protein